MAKLEINNVPADPGALQQREVVITLSRRNLMAMLHKLDMPGSARRIENNDCWEDGVQCPYPGTILVIQCEEDIEHYANRVGPAGPMHPDTESFIAKAEYPPREANL